MNALMTLIVLGFPSLALSKPIQCVVVGWENLDGSVSKMGLEQKICSTAIPMEKMIERAESFCNRKNRIYFGKPMGRTCVVIYPKPQENQPIAISLPAGPDPENPNAVDLESIRVRPRSNSSEGITQLSNGDVDQY